MEFFKQKEILPVDKQTFRKHVLISLLVQFAFVLLMYSLFHFCGFGASDFSRSYFFFVSTIILHFVMSIFIMKTEIFQGRYKDIFPDHKISNVHYLFAMLVPLFFIGFVLYLCFKNICTDSRPPVYLSKLRYSIPLSLIIITLQVFSPKTAYWISGPSTYYVIEVAHDALEVVKFKESTKDGSTVIQDYEKQYSGKLSSTQLILLTAVGAALIIKEKQRSIANQHSKLEASLNSGIKIVKVSYDIILKSESTKLEIWDFSPIHWLYPSGATEIMLISYIELEILEKFNKVLLEKNTVLLKNLESKIFELPKTQRDEYLTQLTDLRSKFENTKTFRSIASVKK